MGWYLERSGPREGRGFYEVRERATYFYADHIFMIYWEGAKLMLEKSPSARERKCEPTLR